MLKIVNGILAGSMLLTPSCRNTENKAAATLEGQAVSISRNQESQVVEERSRRELLLTLEHFENDTVVSVPTLFEIVGAPSRLTTTEKKIEELDKLDLNLVYITHGVVESKFTTLSVTNTCFEFVVLYDYFGVRQLSMVANLKQNYENIDKMLQSLLDQGVTLEISNAGQLCTDADNKISKVTLDKDLNIREFEVINLNEVLYFYALKRLEEGLGLTSAKALGTIAEGIVDSTDNRIIRDVARSEVPSPGTKQLDEISLEQKFKNELDNRKPRTDGQRSKPGDATPTFKDPVDPVIGNVAKQVNNTPTDAVRQLNSAETRIPPAQVEDLGKRLDFENLSTEPRGDGGVLIVTPKQQNL